MKSSPFGSESVIEEKFVQAGAHGYLVGFDLDQTGKNAYRWSSLILSIISVIHEFSYGFHEGQVTENTKTLAKLVEAARAIYKIDHYQKVKDLYLNSGHISDDLDDKFLRRGEFGELILHLLLRDHHRTLPLLSKIYFKDSYGHAVHGFDCVHVEPESKTLWLGESKLYIDPRRGLKELIKDVTDHFNADYMNAEFSLISKKVRQLDDVPEIEEWRRLLSGSTKLKDKFRQICIPLLCTYSCELFTEYEDEEDVDFKDEYLSKMIELKNYFDHHYKHPYKANLNILILLFPVQCKRELVKRLHQKLSILQQVGE